MARKAVLYGKVGIGVAATWMFFKPLVSTAQNVNETQKIISLGDKKADTSKTFVLSKDTLKPKDTVKAQDTVHMPKVELNGGILYYEDLDPLDVSKILKKIAGDGQASDTDALEKVPAIRKGVGKGYYYVFKHGFFGIFFDEKKSALVINSFGSDGNILHSKGACPKPSAETGHLYRLTKTELLMYFDGHVASISYPDNLPPISEDVTVGEVISGGKVQVLIDASSWGDMQMWVRFGSETTIDLVSKATGETKFSFIAKMKTSD